MVKDGYVMSLVEGDIMQTQGKQTQGRDGIDLAEGIVSNFSHRCPKRQW